MANYLKMDKKQQVYGLLQLGWSYRRIEKETGVRRETVSRYHREWLSKAAKVPTGSDEEPVSLEANAARLPTGLPEGRSTAHPYRDFIEAGLAKGLSYQRIWQDLVEEYAYCGSYDSVRRYAKRIKRSRPELADVMHAAPGEEAQVDFFSGPLTLDSGTGRYFRPWVFRMVLSHSRHSYEEAVRTQDLSSFIRCHENAFRFFGGVPRVVRLDNLKAGVARACLYDPDVNPVYAAFASHCGFCPLPCFPGKPEEKGKVEKAGGYLKNNALKGRRFESLSELNEHLKRWNRNIASLRIHGTTRRQVHHPLPGVGEGSPSAPARIPLRALQLRQAHRPLRRPHPGGKRLLLRPPPPPAGGGGGEVYRPYLENLSCRGTSGGARHLRAGDICDLRRAPSGGKTGQGGGV